MSIVSLQKCDSYELNSLINIIELSFIALGGLESLIKPTDSVFIKVNGLAPFAKEKAITTHPEFVRAVIQVLKAHGIYNITVGDNPAVKDMIQVFKKTGIFDVCVEEEVLLCDNAQLSIITNSDALNFKEFEVSEQMVNSDVLINLPKLKTHAFAHITCAQKNLFGFIYGLSKAGWHVKAADPMSFGEAINDLYGAILENYEGKTILNLCDGIIALEGDGPSTGGTPKHLGVVLGSLDAISLDRVALEIAKLNPEKSFINIIGGDRGLGVFDLDAITIVGNELFDFENVYLEAPRRSIPAVALLKIQAIKNITLEHPVIDIEKCIRCGECAKICPPQTLTIQKGEFPVLNASKCIRCWCCAEVCPQNAIDRSKRPLLGRVLLKDRKI